MIEDLDDPSLKRGIHHSSPQILLESVFKFTYSDIFGGNFPDFDILSVTILKITSAKKL